jgi:hypothetical protein
VVANPQTERQFRADDGQVGPLANGQLQEAGGIGEVGVGRAANRRHAGIPGRADDLAGTALSGQSGGQGVLARTAPEHQNSHDVNGLIRVQAMLVQGTISLTLSVDCA